MKKAKLGIILGAAAGIVDIAPMIIQKLTWDANLSAFFFWVVSGYIIATSKIRLKGALRGLLLSIIMLVPLAFIIGWQNPLSLAPIFAMTLILGSCLGYFIDRFGR